MEPYHEWRIEVDQNRQQMNLRAQENFIVRLIGSLYDDMERGRSKLSKIKSMHFSRIFKPASDIGSYVRLRIFAEVTDTADIDEEINNRLSQAHIEGLVFQVRKLKGDWKKWGKNMAVQNSRLFSEIISIASAG